MTIRKTFTSFVLAGGLAALALPAMSQTTMPSQQQTTQPQSRGGEQSYDDIREMMREMMREMRQDETRPNGSEGRWEDRPRMRDWSDRRSRDRMGRDAMTRRGMMGDRAGGMMHGAGMRIMFAIMDTNGDGALALEEVQEFHERIFNMVDENDNGKITMEEVREFFSVPDQ